MSGVRQSVFNSDTTVEHDGTEYRLESDVTMDSTPFFRVTNLDTNDSGVCSRDGDRALLTTTSTLTHAMEDALAQEVDVVIPEGVTRAQVGDGERAGGGE